MREFYLSIFWKVYKPYSQRLSQKSEIFWQTHRYILGRAPRKHVLEPKNEILGSKTVCSFDEKRNRGFQPQVPTPSRLGVFRSSLRKREKNKNEYRSHTRDFIKVIGWTAKAGSKTFTKIANRSYSATHNSLLSSHRTDSWNKRTQTSNYL